MAKKKSKINYRVHLGGCLSEWHYESKHKNKALKWMRKTLKEEKASGYKYSATLYRVEVKKIVRLKNY